MNLCKYIRSSHVVSITLVSYSSLHFILLSCFFNFFHCLQPDYDRYENREIAKLSLSLNRSVVRHVEGKLFRLHKVAEPLTKLREHFLFCYVICEDILLAHGTKVCGPQGRKWNFQHRIIYSVIRAINFGGYFRIEWIVPAAKNIFHSTLHYVALCFQLPLQGHVSSFRILFLLDCVTLN
jgi:hypothetical protein